MRNNKNLLKIFELLGIIVFSLLFVVSCNKDETRLSGINSFAINLDGSELPYIKITTSNFITNEPKVSAHMDIYQNSEKVFSNPIGIEYRGVTSFRMSDKKSYGIETWDESGNDVDVEIFGFPKEEDWILMGHVFRSPEIIFDASLMHHYIGYELYRQMGNYASRSKFVELEIDYIHNGESDYKGIYVFMEKLKRDSKRINISKLIPSDEGPDDITGGYILKIDKTGGSDVAPDNQPLEYYETNWSDDASYNEGISFRSNYDINGNSLASLPPFGPPYHEYQKLETYFLYEYPKAEEITSPQKNYIQSFINDFETALLYDDFTSQTRSYLDYIDLDSFIDYFIINELTGNIDAYRLSTYMHKDKGGKLKMGPIWDLNIGYNRQDRVPFDDWIANYNSYVPNDPWLVPFWWKRLLEDPIFKNSLKTRWELLRANTLSNNSVLSFVDETSQYLISNGAIERNYNKWSGINVDYPSVIADLKSYLNNRLNWMDNEINEL